MASDSNDPSPQDDLDRSFPSNLDSTSASDPSLDDGTDVRPEPTTARLPLPDASTDEDVKLKKLERETREEDLRSKRDARERRADRENEDRPLRKWIARGSLAALVLQIGFSDVIFWRYCSASHWHPSPAALSAWSGGSVVEVIGVVTIITQYLFPSDGRRKD